MKTIFRFVILSDENDSFVREIELSHNHTFLDFHKAVQTACDFDQTQIASFFVVDKKWQKRKELTLLPMSESTGQYPVQNMAQVKLKDICKIKGQRLLYVFDFFTERVLFIYLRNIYPANTKDLLPRLVVSRGKPPKQLITGETYIDNLLNDFSSN